MTTESILTDHGYGIFMYFNAFAGIAVSLLGIPTNLLNIRTFLAMGANDGVTVSFLSLSISDLAASLLNMANCIATALHAYEYYSGTLLCGLDPLLFMIIFVNLSFMTYTITVLNTTYLAITRCMSVVMPLKFKKLFTARRAVIVAVICALVTIAITAPIFFKIRLKPYDGNETLDCERLDLTFPPDREDIKDVVYLFTLTIMPFSSQIIVLICMCVMLYLLKKSSQFRKTMRRNSAKHNPTPVVDSSDGAASSSDSKACSEDSTAGVLGRSDSKQTQAKLVRFINKSSDLSRSLRISIYKRAKIPFQIQSEDGKETHDKNIEDLAIQMDDMQSTDNSNKDLQNEPKAEPLQSKTEVIPNWQVSGDESGLDDSSGESEDDLDVTDSESPMKARDQRRVRHEAGPHLSYKDSRVVQQVVLICAIFILCNLPMIAMGLACYLQPELDASFKEHAYVRMYYGLHFFRRVIEQISSSINFFIYYKYNSKFRSLTWRFLKKIPAMRRFHQSGGTTVSSRTDQLTTSSCSKV